MVLLASKVAQGASKNPKKAGKGDSKNVKVKVLPKVDSVSLKKSFKKNTKIAKKAEKIVSASKKELMKKSLAEKVDNKIVKLTKKVPATVLKAKNNVARSVESSKPVEIKKGKKSKKDPEVESKVTEATSESLKPAKLGKKGKTEKKKKETVTETNKPVSIEKPKSAKKLAKNAAKSTESKENKNLVKKSKDKKDAVAEVDKSKKSTKKSKTESAKTEEAENNQEIKSIKSKKRKHSEVEKVEETVSVGIPPTKKEISNYVKALLKYIESEEKKKKSLFDSEKPPVLLQVNCIKVPKAPLHQMRILLPHSMVKSTDDVALFVPDVKRGRRRDFDETIHHYEDLLQEHGCTAIKAVIPINQVKTEYRQFEMRRKLLASYDYFLIDGRISGHMAHLLGKAFRIKRKLPTSVHMTKKDLKTEIETALRKTSLEVHANGDGSTVQVGTCSMSADQLADNIVAVIEALNNNYPGGWENIRSLRIKTPLSLAIPIYMTLKSRNEVKVPEQKPKRPKAYQEVEGELSTFNDDVRVIVLPDGTVRIKKIADSSDKEESDAEDVENKEIKEEIVKKPLKKKQKNEKKVKVEKK